MHFTSPFPIKQWNSPIRRRGRPDAFPGCPGYSTDGRPDVPPSNFRKSADSGRELRRFHPVGTRAEYSTRLSAVRPRPIGRGGMAGQCARPARGRNGRAGKRGRATGRVRSFRP
ncbi:hypothetical protein GCM10009660_51020 [Catellatospora bangladeshensis]